MVYSLCWQMRPQQQHHPTILDKNFGNHFENRYRFRFLRFPSNFHPLSPSAMLRMEDTLIYNLQHCTGGEGAAVFGKFVKIAGVPIYFVQGCRGPDKRFGL